MGKTGAAFCCRRGGEPRSSRRFRRRGAAAVEVAIVAPLLFFLIFGMIEFGRLVMVRQALTNAAREGCRTAVLVTTGSSQDADTAVRDYLQSVIPIATDVSKVPVEVLDENDQSLTDLSTLSPGTEITVEVGVNFSDVSWLPGSVLGAGGLTLIGRSTQRRE